MGCHTAREAPINLGFGGGGDPIEAIPIAGGRFRGIGLSSPFAFERDAAGHVRALVTFDLGPTRWERESAARAAR
jgi:hypothetical protein